jgi:hypothetical protein
MTNHPFTYTKPVTSESTFVGRKDEFDEILEGFESPNCESVGIVGGRRMGKTSLLLEVKRHLEEMYRRTGGILPVFVDLQKSVPETRRALFQTIIAEVEDELGLLGAPLEIGATALSEGREDKLALRDFEVALASLIRKQKPDFKVALLFDEIDLLVSREWYLEFLSQLRHLLTASNLSQSLVVAIAGSETLQQQLRLRGSPFQNALRKLLYLQVLPKSDLAKLIDMSPRFLRREKRNEILELTGGHPFLTQFVLAKLNESPKASVPTVARRFSTEREDFDYWISQHIDSLSQKTYAVIAAENRHLTLQYLMARVEYLTRGDLEIEQTAEANHLEISDLIRASLRRLEYIGLIRGDDSGAGFELAGTMFRDWFFSTKRSARIRPISPIALRDPVFRELLEAFHTGRCIVFLGSAFRIPSNEELAEAIQSGAHQGASSGQSDLVDLYRSAGEGRSRLNAQVARVATAQAEIIAKQGTRSIYDLVARARAIRKLITTDFGPYLNLINIDEPFRQVYSDANLAHGDDSDRVEYKLAGSSENADSINVLPEDWESWSRRNPVLAKEIFRLFRTHSLHLLGYTREDGFLLELYNLARSDSQTHPGAESSEMPLPRVYGINVDQSEEKSLQWGGQPILDVPVSEEELLFELMNLPKEA